MHSPFFTKDADTKGYDSLLPISLSEAVIVSFLPYQTHWNDRIYLSSIKALYPYSPPNLACMGTMNEELLKVNI
jgi:ubiquitin-protein ligase